MSPIKNPINILFFALPLFALSCREKNAENSNPHSIKNNKIEIKGNIKGLSTKWVYLHNLYPINGAPIDSAQVINDSFTFSFHPDTAYEPHLVYITSKDRKLSLSIIDPFAPNDGKTHWYHEFLMEPGTIELTGVIAKDKGITLKAGLQNKFRFQHVDMPFIAVSKNPAVHKKQVDGFIRSIKEMPDAYYGIFALANMKFEVTNDELKQMFNAFDANTQQGYSAKLIKNFLDTRPGEKDKKPNSLLTDAAGKQFNMIDTTKKLNMLIFWASWCGPCKMEIPSLKTIAAKVKDNRFRMVSVSIDVNKGAWKKALGEQKMSWQQLSIDSASMKRIEAQYNLNGIPQIYFVDDKRNLLKHFDGYDPANEVLFDKTITDFLKAN